MSKAEELIACLEGEIAKRDARIVELESEVRSWVIRIQQRGLEIDEMSDERDQLRAELSALKAQEPAAWKVTNQITGDELLCNYKPGGLNYVYHPLYAAPVSEAKAQGVVMPERKTKADYGVYIDEFADEAAAIYNAALDEVARLNAAHAQQVSVPDEMRSLAQRLREYNQNPHHINPMSEAFHILVADAANALSAACVPKEIAAAITWSEHLLFECGALTSTRAPSVHVYSKTFAAVNEARAMLNAAPAAPAADAGIVDMYRHLQKVTPYRFKKIQDASITDGGDVMYFHKDRFDAALLADMAAHRAQGVV